MARLGGGKPIRRLPDVGTAKPFRPNLASDKPAETCEQRRAHSYGIDDPTDWNHRAIDGPAPGQDAIC